MLWKYKGRPVIIRSLHLPVDNPSEAFIEEAEYLDGRKEELDNLEAYELTQLLHDTGTVMTLYKVQKARQSEDV